MSVSIYHAYICNVIATYLYILISWYVLFVGGYVGGSQPHAPLFDFGKSDDDLVQLALQQ